VNKFNVQNGIYKTEQNVDGLIYPTLLQELP
jgi:NitT/TauT family transport system substrate-binding protein